MVGLVPVQNTDADWTLLTLTKSFAARMLNYDKEKDTDDSAQKCRQAKSSSV